MVATGVAPMDLTGADGLSVLDGEPLDDNMKKISARDAFIASSVLNPLA